VSEKIASDLAAQTTVWAVYPDENRLTVVAPGVPPKRLTMADMLDGGDGLPGFSVPVKDLFPTAK